MEPGRIVRTFTSKKGRDVQLRYPTKEDFKDIWGFACALADEDTFVTLNERPGRDEEQRWLDDTLRKIEKGDLVHLEVFVNGDYAGNGRVERGTFRHTHVGGVGISLSPQYRGEGIGTELLRSLIDEARGLRLRLLTLSCFENNTRALHVYEKLGFVKSGITPGAIAYKGAYIGEVHYYLPLT